MKDWLNKCHVGDCLETLRRMPDGFVQTCVTSPPYFGLRDYGHAGQIGLEPSPDEFVAKLVEVFREVRRVLRDDGTLWLNLGDSYAGSSTVGEKRPGSGRADGVVDARAQRNRNGLGRVDGIKPKDLIGIPWRVAFALQADGWYLRQEIIWAKPNPMPESVTDRCTKSHEHLFLLAKSERYHCDMEAIAEPAAASSVSRWAQNVAEQAGSGRVPGKTNGPMKATGGPLRKSNSDVGSAVPGATDHGGLHRERSEREPAMRNKRSVWTVATKPYKGAHFAVYPEELIEPCILAGAPVGSVVLDPFFGSGTSGAVAQRLGRHYVGCELNPAYVPLQDARLHQPSIFLEQA